MSGGLVGNARIARELGVTPAAVSNWLRREIIPRHLRPQLIDGQRPAWQEDLIPDLLQWHEARHGTHWVTLEADPADLLPGDVVARLSWSAESEGGPSSMTVTIRRRGQQEEARH